MAMMLVDKEELEHQKQANLDFYKHNKDRLAAEYPGEYVAIAHGKLFGHAAKFRQALELCPKQLDGTRTLHKLVLQAGAEPRHVRFHVGGGRVRAQQ